MIKKGIKCILLTRKFSFFSTCELDYTYKAAKIARLSDVTECNAKRLKDDLEWNIFEKC